MKKVTIIFLFFLLAVYLFAETPYWQWTESACESDWNKRNLINTYADGNSYLTDRFEGTASFGYFDLTSSGSEDIFITKMSEAGIWLYEESACGSFSYQSSGDDYTTDDLYLIETCLVIITIIIIYRL